MSLDTMAPLGGVPKAPPARRQPRPHNRPKTSRDYAPLLVHPHRVMFLDIETTGLSRYYDHITVIGYEMDGVYSAWVAGDDPSEFLANLGEARSVVTFNGSGFDLPFLADTFGDVAWPRHHVDLRYACRRVGLTGGQKVIESALGIACRDDVVGVDGAMAVLLWHRFLRGDVAALATLIAYNRADVRAMAHIVDHVITSSNDLWSLTVAANHSFGSSPDVRRGRGALGAAPPPAPVHLRPSTTFDQIFVGTSAESSTVVGIDLTGSERRPSGLCVLRGRHAEVSTLASDDAILAATLAAKPDLVSLDSPLCIPVGRTRVTDDDPFRYLGIMRESERVLKRRGINVYPCLIPSMQRLTERGIRLAERLRQAGLPVIECYPGAAQDIIGVPRKGAGIAWLTMGMADFGIQGDFTSGVATHDELDAVTCSMVGLFHLAGRSEGLGGDGEEPMIVPRLDPAGAVIGISGRMFAGKTTAARALARSGLAYTRISEVIDDVIAERGGAPSRETRQAVGLELHETMGQRWLCRRAIERVGGRDGSVVVDGLRWTEDATYLRERFGGRFIHLHLSAPPETRLKRACANGMAAEFVEADRHPVEQGIATLESLADIVIENDSSVAALEQSVMNILRDEYAG